MVGVFWQEDLRGQENKTIVVASVKALLELTKNLLRLSLITNKPVSIYIYLLNINNIYLHNTWENFFGFHNNL